MDSQHAQLREEGKEHFKAKNYTAAIVSYSNCITGLTNQHEEMMRGAVDTHEMVMKRSLFRQSVVSCVTNRAVCHVKSSQWSRALEDAAAAVTIGLSPQTQTQTQAQTQTQTHPSEPVPLSVQPKPVSLSLSKPLYILAKALYHLALDQQQLRPPARQGQRGGDRETATETQTQTPKESKPATQTDTETETETATQSLCADSLSVLHFLALMDPINAEARQLTAVVSQSLSSPTGQQEQQQAAAVCVSPSRLTVPCSFVQAAHSAHAHSPSQTQTHPNTNTQHDASTTSPR